VEGEGKGKRVQVFFREKKTFMKKKGGEKFKVRVAQVACWRFNSKSRRGGEH